MAGIVYGYGSSIAPIGSCRATGTVGTVRMTLRGAVLQRTERNLDVESSTNATADQTAVAAKSIQCDLTSKNRAALHSDEMARLSAIAHTVEDAKHDTATH